jgi:ribosomal 30S subunit maturation factor RimM
MSNEIQNIDPDLAVKFANWKDEECFFNIKGYLIYDDDSAMEFQNDELYQYWFENIYQQLPQ